MRDVYQLYVTGKNKVQPSIEFTTRIELKEKEVLSDDETKKLCDADSIIAKEFKLIGYRVDCRDNETGKIVVINS